MMLNLLKNKSLNRPTNVVFEEMKFFKSTGDTL